MSRNRSASTASAKSCSPSTCTPMTTPITSPRCPCRRLAPAYPGYTVPADYPSAGIPVVGTDLAVPEKQTGLDLSTGDPTRHGGPSLATTGVPRRGSACIRPRSVAQLGRRPARISRSSGPTFLTRQPSMPSSTAACTPVITLRPTHRQRLGQLHPRRAVEYRPVNNYDTNGTIGPRNAIPPACASRS